MATGDTNDIAQRIANALPSRWFPDLAGAPVLSALLGGIATQFSAMWTLLVFAVSQARLSTASGWFIDLIAADYFGGNLPRQAGETDPAYASRIRLTLLLSNATRAAMTARLETLTGHAPRIFEPSRPADAGGWCSRANPTAGGPIGFDTGPTLWGTRKPYVAFIVQERGGGYADTTILGAAHTAAPIATLMLVQLKN